MSDSEIIIHDHTSLIQLNEAIDYCGDSMLKLLKNVDAYFEATLGSLERQRDYIKELLDKAEAELREAEQALSDCESSQKWDEEDRCYRPSCNAQKSHVESAKNHYNECKEKYDKACAIVSECKSGYEGEYKHIGGFITPHGAEKTLEYLAKEHTDEANRKMDGIIADVEDYLEIPHNETNENEALPSAQSQKFKEAADKIKEKQKRESDHNRIADANVAMVCMGCKLPIAICRCPRMKERVR